MNISLPRSLRAFIEERVRTRAYGSSSEYLRDLVRKDEAEAAKERLRALLLEGLESPPGRSWADLHASLRRRVRLTRKRK